MNSNIQNPHSTPTLDASVAHDPALSLFQKVLLTTDGTVTQLIELYSGEPITVQKLNNEVIPSKTIANESQSLLQVNADTPLLQRMILLCGASKSYLYAESLFVLQRLPAAMRLKLESTNIPIGLLWREARLETHREIIAYQRETNVDVARHLGLAANTELLSRTYLLYNNGMPLGLITEKFPAIYF